MHPIIVLAHKGLHLVPWRNRKAQVRKPIWSEWNQETPAIERIEAALLEYPKADWAVVPRSGYMVLDLDVKDGKDGIAVVSEWCNDNGCTLQDLINGCAVVRTYSKGLHVWFRYTGELPTTTAAAGVEFKHSNQSVHVPPSEGYEWEASFSSIEELKEIPTWLVEKWEGATNRRKEVKLYTQPTIEKGERHNFLVSYGAKLRDLNMSIEEIGPALHAIAKSRFTEEFPPHEIDAIAKSFKHYAATDTSALALSGDPHAQAVMAFGTVEREEEVDVTPILDDAVIPSAELEVDLLNTNEMISQWCKTVDYNCPMIQPMYCLASAIAGIGTMMGRRYTFNGCYANNYIVLLGATSTGKNAPLAVTKAIFKAVGLSHLIGASELTSGEGVAKQISEKNEIVWLIDEMALLLRGLSHNNAPPYLIGINKQLLQLYSGGSNEGAAKAEGVERTIENPYPNILACAQPSTFAECINKYFIESGFLGRFVCLSGRDDFHGKPFGQYKGNDKNPIIEQSFIDMLKEHLSSWQAPLSIATGSSAKCPSTEIASTDDANELINQYFHELADRRLQLTKESNSYLSDIISKNREKLLKFAMVHAFSSNPASPVITGSSIRWARAVLKLSDATVELAVSKMCENGQQRDVNKIYEFIKRAGKDGATATAITGSVVSIKKKERDSIIEDLIFSNKIVMIKDSSKPGRPKTTYYLKQFAPKKPKENTDAK